MSLAPSPVISLRDLERTFPGTPPVPVLRGVNLSVDEGEYVSIVGPSGSGKSTLLNILGLLDSADAGSYFLDGYDTSGLSDQDRTALRGQRIGFIFQSFQLLPHRSALDNVRLAETYLPIAAEGRTERARTALEQVGLGHRVDAFPTTLSGGEQQRVAIARALLGSPSLILADEPTGNLDSRTSGSILELFDQLHSDGLTLLVITHDDHVSQRAQRRVGIIDGTMQELEMA